VVVERRHAVERDAVHVLDALLAVADLRNLLQLPFEHPAGQNLDRVADPVQRHAPDAAHVAERRRPGLAFRRGLVLLVVHGVLRPSTA